MGDDDDRKLWASEALVSDAIGRLIEFWGFKRNMGRIWTVLYLSNKPLSARDLQERLHLSAGSVSMTVKELARWGVIQRVWIQGERRDYFEPESNLWKMVSRVLQERERTEILQAIDRMEEALDLLAGKVRSPDPVERERARVQRERIRQLLDLAHLGRRLLEALVETGKVDVRALGRVLLGGRD
jgi:HTH-type transcriptional regulator, glycine betaine synthesis regulator